MAANRGAKIVLHWLETSRAHRAMWLMEELNLSYEVNIFRRSPNGTAPPELKDIHPLGKSPVLSIHPPNATKPMVLAESAPILEYLLEHFGNENANLIPRRYVDGKEGELGGETDSWMRYQYFMHYAEGSLMSPIQVQLILNAVKNAPVPFFIKPIMGIIPAKISSEFLDQELKTHFTSVENQLASAPGQGPFLCGTHLTMADIQMCIPVIGALDLSIISEEEYPRLAAYSRELQACKGYRQAAQRIEKIEGKPFKLV